MSHANSFGCSNRNSFLIDWAASDLGGLVNHFESMDASSGVSATSAGSGGQRIQGIGSAVRAGHSQWRFVGVLDSSVFDSPPLLERHGVGET